MTTDNNNYSDDYWRGTVDSSLKEIKDTLSTMNKERSEAKKEHESRVKAVLIRLDKIEEKFSMWATVVKTIKFIGLAIVAILAFKAGTIVDIWTKVFS